MITTIPFSGFYNSIHNWQIDHSLESMLCDSYSNTNDKLLSELIDSIDYQRCFESYAKEYTGRFSERFGISLEFESLRSPKYYNFETDRIFCKISDSEIVRIFSLTKKETLKEKIKERFTSCSGFISHYPNDLESWDQDPTTWDHNELGTLIEAYISDHDEHSEEYELSISEYISEVSYKIIDPHIGERGVRALNIFDYLMRREERAL